VTAIAAGDASFTVQDANGTVQTFQVTPASTVAQQLSSGQIAVNAVVSITYTTSATPPNTTGASGITTTGALYTATAVTVNAPPPPVNGGGVGLIVN
jgi:outer membrane usher protein FimD/PapC